ncbi:MAG: circularly permuted type 2 ATP-grasp protein [Chitinophagales bacterium]
MSHTSPFSNYKFSPDLKDEVWERSDKVNESYKDVHRLFESMSISDFRKLNEYARLSFLNQGITYAVYSEENGGTEKIFPFDLFPRIISAKEWEYLEVGLKQRNMALNLFVKDIYNKKQILKDKVVPEKLILSSSHYCKLMEEISPKGGIYTHICGTDLIKNVDGNFYVLEDNLRSPSGVSYVLSNRKALRRTLMDVFHNFKVKAVNEYPFELCKVLESVAPSNAWAPTCVLLTPGLYNSAYYEHSFLAQTTGIELVEGRDLFVENNFVYMKTIKGRVKVDVIYRRIDDAFLDPDVFRPDSLLGVKGLMSAYKKNNVTIVNAPGTGIADDKAVCSYVPDMIKYYLDEDPIIKNVPTFLCERKKDLDHVLSNIKKMVIKPVDMSGGYGVEICDTKSDAELEVIIAKIKADPRNFIAQPKMSLSVHSTYIDEDKGFQPRHIDLRTYTLLGKDYQFTLGGGLSRVALKEGSLIVNSSQGGGSKDTWVIDA